MHYSNIRQMGEAGPSTRQKAKKQDQQNSSFCARKVRFIELRSSQDDIMNPNVMACGFR